MQLTKERKNYIKKQANDFRKKCVISGYGIDNLFKECKKAGIKAIRYPLNKSECYGFAVKKDNDNIIFTNSSIRLSREIFTLAHEIGHVILHLKDGIYQDYKTTANHDIKEQEANYFAVCLLMPENELKTYIDCEIKNIENSKINILTIARIMSEFSVSFETVLNSLENIGIINKRTRNSLDNEKNKFRISNLIRSAGGNEKLNKATYIKDIPMEYLDYAIFNYNKKAIPETTLIKVLDEYGLDINDIQDQLIDPPARKRTNQKI